jgi:hypothetical protein
MQSELNVSHVSYPSRNVLWKANVGRPCTQASVDIVQFDRWQFHCAYILEDEEKPCAARLEGMVTSLVSKID